MICIIGHKSPPDTLWLVTRHKISTPEIIHIVECSKPPKLPSRIILGVKLFKPIAPYIAGSRNPPTDPAAYSCA